VKYDRKEVMALRLRATMGLKRLTRKELFSRLQLVRTLEPIIEDSYRRALRESWRDQLDDSPHGHPWHVSFHASQFPGDDPMACSREAVYRMADFTAESEPSRRLHLTAITGKALETDLVDKLHRGSGMLISAPPDAEVQTGFEIPELMLTGSVDSAIVLRKKATPVEIKTKHESDIRNMLLGLRGPDEKHVKQLKTQMGLIRAAQENGDLWSDLKLCDGGFIYYMARDQKYDPREPIPTAEFWVQYDATFFETGVEQLKRFRALWEEELLAENKPGKRTTRFGHPHGWKWSYEPCKFCSYKKVCQEDFRGDIQALDDSNGIRMTKEIRPDYSYSDARERVKRRWSPKKPAIR